MAVVDRGLGFHFKRSGEDFIHPVILTAVGSDGLIARHLYGERLLPFGLTMAATEAAQGKTGLSVRRMLSYCFTYDPESKAYAFNFLRVTATVVILLVSGLFLALVLAGRKKRRKALPLAHAVNGLILAALALCQIWSGVTVLRGYVFP